MVTHAGVGHVANQAVIPDGIYLNLPMDDYRRDKALGGSDLKAILGNAVQWHARERNDHWRTLNPPSDDETASSRFGTALHVMTLEPGEFDHRYAVEVDAPNLPNTKEDIGEALLKMGRDPPAMGKKKIHFEAAARLHGVRLLSDWKYDQAMIRGEREAISPAWDRSLRLLRQVLEAHSQAPKFLRHGRAEVSVFWTDPTGLRLKCRFDYLRVRPVSDVKSYACREDEEPVQSFVGAIERFGYDFSAAHYSAMRVEAVPQLVAARQVYDGLPYSDSGKLTVCFDEDLDFFDKVAAEREPTWCWIACMTQGWPEVDTIELPMSLLQFSAASTQVDMAKQTYRDFRDKFGDDGATAWVQDRGLVRLTDFNFSRRAADRGSIRWEQA